MKKTTGRKKLYSVLTDDLKHCIITGSQEVAIHHVFNGANRSRSEAYGFIVPLRPDWHNMTPYSVHMNQEFDESLKRQAQEYYEAQGLYIATRRQHPGTPYRVIYYQPLQDAIGFPGGRPTLPLRKGEEICRKRN